MILSRIILLPELFDHSAKEILEMIECQIVHVATDKRSYLRRNIKRFIKKRYVFEELFNVRCIGCGTDFMNKNI